VLRPEFFETGEVDDFYSLMEEDMERGSKNEDAYGGGVEEAPTEATGLLSSPRVFPTNDDVLRPSIFTTVSSIADEAEGKIPGKNDS
jgi:hypothetical protein